MKRIINFIKKDYTLALRDSIALYIILAPLLLALAVRLFLPTVEDVKLNFIVSGGIGHEVVAQLSEFGTVETLDTNEEVYARIAKIDAVPGLVVENGDFKMVFEGNEPREIVESYKLVFEKVINGNAAYPARLEALSNKKPMLYGLMSTIIVMTALFLGGAVSGFNIVAEKDSKAIRAMAATPLRMGTYLLSRGISAILVSILIGMLSAWILSGAGIDYGKLALSLLAAGPLVAAITLLIGRMADNQINSIAAIKLIMPVYLTLPLAALFLPQKFLFVLFPLPNYWAFRSYQHIFLSEGTSGDFYLSVAVLFGLGALVVLTLSKLFRKHFGLR